MHWLNRHRLVILAAICALWTGLILIAHFFPSVPFISTPWRSEQGFEDLLRREGRKTPTNPNFVFVGIDESTLQFQPFDQAQVANNRALQLMAAEPYPWSREVWALFMDRLFKAGARLVMFDFLFDKARAGDAEFHAALDRYRDKVVIAANFDLSGVRDQGGMAVNVPPNADLIPPPQMQDDRVGYVVFFPDPLDKKIRSVRYTLTDLQLAGEWPRPGEIPYESLSARALEKLGHAADVPRDLQSHLMRFGEMNAYLPRPLWEIFDNKIWHANYADGAFFKNKIVMVGASSQIAHDVFDTPISPETPGPTLHLYALAAALDHEFLHNTPPWFNLTTIVCAGVLAWVVVAFIRRPFLCFVVLLAIGAAYLGVARIFYDRLGLFILAVPPLSAFLGGGMSGLGFEYTLERLEKLRTRRTLERYVSKNLVKEILDNPGGFYSTMLGSRKPVTVLFSDLVGFTSMTEHADPVSLVTQLNEYLSCMVPHVFDNGGTLDKFIGDAIMAVWGNVSSHGTAADATSAVKAALGMRAALPKLNEKWRSEGKKELHFGVGINHGEAVVGNIGSYEPHERLDPTVIGDAVNLASRLEGLTRVYGVDILLGEAVSEIVRDQFHLRTVARAQVKGKTKPVEICTLVGARDENIDPELLKWMEVYEEAIRRFRDRDFKQAKILFSQFLEFYPDDVLAKMYLDRTLEYEQAPPDEAWNAVEVFKKK